MTVPARSTPAAATPRVLDDPLATVLLGIAGGALVGSRGELAGPRRGVVTVAGLALIGAAAFRPLSSLLLAAGTERRSSELRIAYSVALPVERVFAFCRDFENFPRFIGALRSVRDFGDGRSRWCASTPGGDEVVWETITTKYVPNHVIAWETTPRSPVHATGIIRFRPEGRGTCVEMQLGYAPTEGGTVRDALAALLSPRRESQLRRDIDKLIHYLETAPEPELDAYGM